VKGLVKIIKNDSIYEESSNMILNGMGSVLADAQMASPSWSSIASASALLDTSNYTVQAISFGKDARGYYNHAHNTTDAAIAASLADGIIRVIVPTYNVSSYNTSAVTTFSRGAVVANEYHGKFQPSAGDTYKLLPEFSNPIQTKLEQGFFGMPIEYSSVVGHNENKLRTEDKSWAGYDNRELYGCYPASGGTKYYLLSSWDNLDTPVGSHLGSDSVSGGASGTAVGRFNTCSSMDRDGFVKIMVNSAAAANLLGAGTGYGSHSGLTVWAQSDFSSTGKVQYITTVSGGDLLMAGLFGGIYTLGLWAIDIKETIKNGISAPFPFDHIDNKIKYRLVARKTFTKDLTFIHDYLTYSGYRFLEDLYTALDADNKHLTIQWELQF
tara:strand:+ start:6956 stop:8101 length:1146 start_codon:yes stop_codon:yes gene_type:complete